MLSVLAKLQLVAGHSHRRRSLGHAAAVEPHAPWEDQLIHPAQAGRHLLFQAAPGILRIYQEEVAMSTFTNDTFFSFGMLLTAEAASGTCDTAVPLMLHQPVTPHWLQTDPRSQHL